MGHAGIGGGMSIATKGRLCLEVTVPGRHFATGGKILWALLGVAEVAIRKFNLVCVGASLANSTVPTHRPSKRSANPKHSRSSGAMFW